MERKITILFFGLILGLYSCHKDSGSDYPKVLISSPYSMEYFNVPGTIQVTGSASDSKTLTSVTVYLATSLNSPVEQVVQLPVTSNNMNVSCAYTLNDIHLASGKYYMTITTSNGTNVSSAFQEVYVTGVPVKRMAIYAFTRNSSGVHAWGIDSVFNVSPTLSYTVSGDYSSSDVNSYYGQLYIAGHDSGNVNVSSIDVPYPPQSAWNILGSVSPSPYFTNIYCMGDNEFISYANLGYVKCYNHKGVEQTTYNTYSGDYPIKTLAWLGFVFIEEKSISSQSENIWTFYEGSSVKQQNSLPAGSVVALWGYDNNDIFIFGNRSSGGAYIQFYNFSNSTFYTPSIPLTSYGQLLSVVQINANNYLMSFDNGNIIHYSYATNNFVPYITGITASTVRYDSIDNQVIASSGNIVNAYNYGLSSATLTNSVTISDSVRDVRILFNK